MSPRLSGFLLAAVLATAAQPPQPPAKLPSLLEGEGVATLRLEAPLHQLFETGSEDENVTVPGVVTFKDPQTGTDVALRDVEVSVRGHTSRRETECTFPKLKLKLKGAGSLKIGTHCGESPDSQLTEKYGRLANEKSPQREGLAYRMLSAAGVPSLRARLARVTYVDSGESNAQPLTRNALLLEDRSTSTEENTRNTAVICRARGWTKVVAVSDPYHLWRVRRDFALVGLTAYTSPALACERDRKLSMRVLWTAREGLALTRDLLQSTAARAWARMR
jgi:uncharacterized SAM-binding protein YcdF (DUF218 family)